ncbi:transcriptional regulator [Agaricicola taiwanensis]|uniref:Transcriptional regulator n=1 Tax=Agaricicola taiwanensis TaxID=591372 RepID=A0A8J2VGT3_9RHOB|nr:helix-turn-helix transcriptional regulator [Agaricicola taiwanensis]GGE30455.1 transcriptional regulator [Agaricicola taiwanensis]
MLTHSQIWKALDALAESNNLSPSGLAKRAGLDPTTFNRSKRSSADGRQRWPSTESIAKALDATSTTMDTFIGFISDDSRARPRRSIPLIGFSEAAKDAFFDDAGFPKGEEAWDEIGLPAFGDEHTYALEITGDSLLPLYRDGDRILVSPTTEIRRGDRVIVRTTKGELVAGELKRRTVKVMELTPVGAGKTDRSFTLADVSWVARIIWASQ